MKVGLLALLSSVSKVNRPAVLVPRPLRETYAGNRSSTGLKTTWPRGLKNHGLTCYANSIVQLLFWMRPIQYLILDTLVIEDLHEARLFLELKKVFKNLSIKSAIEAVDPQQLMTLVAEKYSFPLSDQHDAHDLLMRLVQSLDEYLIAAHQKAPKAQLDLISAYFNIPPSDEVHLRLQLTQDREQTFQMALAGAQAQAISDPPSYLILLCNRVNEDHIKLGHTFAFPEVFKLKGCWDFDLEGIVVHSGSSMLSGHYFSCLKADSQDWFMFNDGTVSRWDIKDRHHLYSLTDLSGCEHGLSSAYLLVYKLRGDDAQHQQRVTEIKDRHVNSEHEMNEKRVKALNIMAAHFKDVCSEVSNSKEVSRVEECQATSSSGSIRAWRVEFKSSLKWQGAPIPALIPKQ